jgi:hypothetical protein
MKTLLLKLVALVVPFAVLVAALVAHLEHSPSLRYRVYNPELEGKFKALLHPDTAVVIAGDSRAQVGLVPRLIEAYTGRKAANVAATACDLVTVRNAVKRYGLPSGDHVVIFSESIFQVNDGAIDPVHFSRACMLNMTLREKLIVHRENLAELLVDMMDSLTHSERAPETVETNVLREEGYNGLEGHMRLPLMVVLDPKTTDHPWYRSLSLHGARWRIFRESLHDLAAAGHRIYFINVPMSPAWRSYSAGSFIDRAEREYAEMLRKETSHYPNVRFIDFYSAPDPRLTDDDFYEIQHLNRVGAQKFTLILLEKIGADL